MHTLSDMEAWVQEALRDGLQGLEVLLEDRQTVEGRIERRGKAAFTRDTRSTLRVRAWVDGRLGRAEGPVDDPAAVITAARAAAADGPGDPHGGPVGRLGLPARGLGILDPRHDQLSDDDRADVLLSADKAARAAGHVSPGAFGWRDDRTRRRFVNSRGVRLDEDATRFAVWGALALDTPEGPLHLRDGISGRAFASVACLPFGQLLARRAEELLAKPAPPLDGPVRVLLPSRPLGRLVAWMAPLFTLEHLEAGDTWLGHGGDRGPQLHPRFHVVDDGREPGGLRTRAFDDRGVPPVPLTLIREGRVDARFLTPAQARRLGARPTGHEGADGVRPSNLQVHGGARTINAHLGEQDGLVFAVDDLDTASGFDPATGAIDTVVDGRVFDRQTAVGPLRRVRLVGSLPDALARVAAIASDTDRIDHVDAPSIFVDGFSVHR